jgi:SHS2 domain-containing protein
MYWIISPSKHRGSSRALTAEAEADDPAVALARALQRLLVSFDSDGFLASSARVTHPPATPSRCRIEARGDTFDAARHTPGVEVKAVTHHDLVLDAKKRRVEVLFDI